MKSINKNINGGRDETQNSGIQDTVLWTGSIYNTGETATLNDSIENYKIIEKPKEVTNDRSKL